VLGNTNKADHDPDKRQGECAGHCPPEMSRKTLKGFVFCELQSALQDPPNHSVAADFEGFNGTPEVSSDEMHSFSIQSKP
jgi:hypothetical protein